MSVVLVSVGMGRIGALSIGQVGLGQTFAAADPAGGTEDPPKATRHSCEGHHQRLSTQLPARTSDAAPGDQGPAPCAFAALTPDH